MSKKSHLVPVIEIPPQKEAAHRASSADVLPVEKTPFPLKLSSSYHIRFKKSRRPAAARTSRRPGERQRPPSLSGVTGGLSSKVEKTDGAKPYKKNTFKHA
jgi:hypothetical protein